jgi:hypothetical protein
MRKAARWRAERLVFRQTRTPPESEVAGGVSGTLLPLYIYRGFRCGKETHGRSEVPALGRRLFFLPFALAEWCGVIR